MDSGYEPYRTLGEHHAKEAKAKDNKEAQLYPS
jgi:hypothetical protein